ncbi:expansin EXLX1 family cellulose-binding protein [Plantactinospora sp. WMMB782]|uniref:expansin EXLX1 family cellulose-binding protein n=1 Tax=Plantactinospora sp. WMMB782 TaxID=3404121 RepID=UPI003B947B21
MDDETVAGPGPAPDQSRRRSSGGRRWFAGRRRWFATGAAAALAGVLGIALAVQSAAAPGCAAPPTGGRTHQGKATFYDLAGGGGNCSYVKPPADRLYVALGPSEYAAAAACGGYLDVTGPDGSVRVLVVDRCPECGPGHIDLSREAFTRIADPVRGIVPVTYRAVVDPPLPGPLTFRMKDGASAYWFAVLVGEHGNPLRSVQARPAGSGSFRDAARQDYNYWVIDGGLGSGPYTIRVTDVYGNQAVADGIRLAPEQTQRSRVRMYGGAPGRPAARATSRVPRPSTIPTSSASAGTSPESTPPADIAPSAQAASASAAPSADCAG